MLFSGNCLAETRLSLVTAVNCFLDLYWQLVKDPYNIQHVEHCAISYCFLFTNIQYT
jgi:hypothetical protein